MSPALHIGSVRTRLRSREPIAAERLSAWEVEFAAQDGEALAGRWVQPEEWLLLRRLPLHARWRVDEADAEVGHAWRDALDRAIAEALARDDGSCVRYRHRREALADMLYRSALRDSSRQWAWRRMDLIPRAELPTDEALYCALREIEQQPELAWPVLMCLLEAEQASAAFTATLRALGGSLVPQLLRLSPRSAPYLQLHATSPAHGQAPDAGAPAKPDAAWPTAALALIGWARSRPALAQRHRDALAPLLAAIAWPAPGTADPALRLWLNHAQAEIASAAAGARPTPPGFKPMPQDRSAAAIAASENGPDPAPAAAIKPLAVPAELSATETRHATRWGGALFWLTRLGEAWRELDPQPELALLLRETALALGVAADDAVLRAFCGGEVADGEAAPAVIEAARRLVASWEAWLRDVAPDLPEPRLTSVCQRSGRLVLEPGWSTLHLPLNSVDTAIRRLGLDLDPGWLPWLGCVIRICYDDA